MLITVKLRVCDKHASELNRLAGVVNLVWNYCNETQQKAVRSGRKWLTAYDLGKLTAGSSKIFAANGMIIERTCHVYAANRSAKRRPWLRWRSKKSLGWVPFKEKTVRFDGKRFLFNRGVIETMHLRDELVAGQKIKAGSFNRDARGRWYLNIAIDSEADALDYAGAVGIDLGLKTLATLSSGDKIEMPRFYRESEIALGAAQRARKSRRAKAIQAKASNRRSDFLHKASNALVREYGTIFVGDVSPSKLAKTNRAKSIYDAGWSGFKHMLSYKAIRHGGRMIEVSEAYSSRTCSACGCIGGPAGLKGLAVREWRCDCGAVHDRDVNAAQNILRVGLDTLVEGAAA